ncbi:thermonuclease family protein [Mesomycoplasma molare]|uniref:Thermonuclease family protein n=1 Tax=Mesomycoplasma molare TaxID=171288 RepID=A0ABY5TX71_9BACT|nr:thermonuclease family protein [Mesomycoplasma molare]UWD34181.1 thermonuclease family protein [Mesomycoplasma molare]
MKKFIKTTGLVVFPLFYSAAFVSCGETYEQESEKLPAFENNFQHIPGKIVRWNDGDTPIVDFGDNELLKGQFSIRISGIDTPEKKLKDTEITPLEYEYAQKATEFAENLLPKGSEVMLVFEGSEPKTSYNRKVGWIFYKDKNKENSWLNYSAEIVRQGLSFPNLDNASEVSFKENIWYTEGIKLWNAFHQAWNKHLNIFEGVNNEGELLERSSQIYKSRGVPKHSPFLKSEEDNILVRHLENKRKEKEEK